MDQGEGPNPEYDDNPVQDPCEGVVCQEVNCPVGTYIPMGECCPVCPSGFTEAPGSYGSAAGGASDTYGRVPDEVRTFYRIPEISNFLQFYVFFP